MRHAELAINEKHFGISYKVTITNVAARRGRIRNDGICSKKNVLAIVTITNVAAKCGEALLFVIAEKKDEAAIVIANTA